MENLNIEETKSDVCPCQSRPRPYFRCPKIESFWKCCEVSSTNVFEVVNHIKETHIFYASTLQVDSVNNFIWRYKCKICNDKHWRLDDTLTFFLDAHVQSLDKCLNCNKKFEFPYIYEHAVICHAADLRERK